MFEPIEEQWTDLISGQTWIGHEEDRPNPFDPYTGGTVRFKRYNPLVPPDRHLTTTSTIPPQISDYFSRTLLGVPTPRVFPGDVWFDKKGNKYGCMKHNGLAEWVQLME